MCKLHRNVGGGKKGIEMQFGSHSFEIQNYKNQAAKLRKTYKILINCICFFITIVVSCCALATVRLRVLVSHSS
jgi:hypothetical protein